MNGSGEMRWGDGREYKGTWKDGKRHGKSCEMSWPNGDKYAGEFADDKRNGGGKAVSAAGSV